MLERLGLRRSQSDGERVAILVGPNGAGKSNFLKALAVDLRGERNLAVISNTAYDRFAGMRGIKRISASRSGRSPKGVVKRAIAVTIDEPDSRFYQIGKTLEYCGYRPRLGFRIVGNHKRGSKRYSHRVFFDSRDYESSISFLERHDPRETIWIDSGDPILSFSLARDFSSVLRCEDSLRKEGVIGDIEVYLQRHDGEIIELLRASSGELALISSLIFLITTIDPDPVILIDEPENSLHPKWQREYVNKILNTVEYRNATIVIATHAPLVVTGALASFSHLVSIFQVSRGEPKQLDLAQSTHARDSIEAVLWRAFDVITPASHYVSEELASVVTRLEEGKIDKEAALALVDGMNRESFDDQQRDFFRAVRELIDKVVAERQGRIDRDG